METKRFERVDFKKKKLKRQGLRHTLVEGEEEVMDGHSFSTVAVKIKNMIREAIYFSLLLTSWKPLNLHVKLVFGFCLSGIFSAGMEY